MHPYTHGGFPVSKSIINIIEEIDDVKKRRHVQQKVGRFLVGYFELMRSASTIENKAHKTRVLLLCRDSSIESLKLVSIEENLRSHIENLVKTWHKEYCRGIRK